MNGTAVSDFAELTDPVILADFMRERLADSRNGCISVALHAKGRSATSSISPVMVRAGCLAQLFTATLVLVAVRHRKFFLDDEIRFLLPAVPQRPATAFAGVTVRHLLNHTHGLDGSCASPVPMRPDGRIDVARICSALTSTPPLAAPGAIYCHGTTGSYVAAAILEGLFECSFEQLLNDELLAPLGIPLLKDSEGNQTICPATGGCLVLSAQSLLKFALWHLQGCTDDVTQCTSLDGFAEMYRIITPLPGFCLEQGAGLGWMWYGQDWFGCVATTRSGSAVVRIQRGGNVAFAVAATECNAVYATARLFGSQLPEFVNLRFPTALEGDDLSAVNLRQYTGCYQNAATSMEVSQTNGFELAMRVHGRSAGPDSVADTWSATLQPCGNDLFKMDFAPKGYSLFTHFSRPGGLGYTYVHNGAHLLRRATVESP